jgi:hypothetical protein
MSIDPVLKQKAIQLRLQGKSYTAILRQLQLKSKGTLSIWFRGLELPPKTQRLLKNNISRAAERGFFEFNRNRTARIRSENEAAYHRGIGEIGTLTTRELFLVGAALYWGEGTKYERVGGTAAVVFTNSDPEMIRVFLCFVRLVLKIKEDRIRAGINLYDIKKIATSRKYWAGVTGLPEERFYISRLISGASSGKRDKNRLPHGTVSIRISNRKEFYRIKGMIRGLIEGCV